MITVNASWETQRRNTSIAARVSSYGSILESHLRQTIEIMTCLSETSRGGKATICRT